MSVRGGETLKINIRKERRKKPIQGTEFSVNGRTKQNWYQQFEICRKVKLSIMITANNDFAVPPPCPKTHPHPTTSPSLQSQAFPLLQLHRLDSTPALKNPPSPATPPTPERARCLAGHTCRLTQG